MKRLFDFTLAILLIIVLFVVMLSIAIVIKLSSRGPALHWSDRIGQENTVFKMPKFRSMHIGTPQMATHLMPDPSSFLTPIGGFLRRSSLDELPQLYSVLIGKMSFVGPRPALFNQEDLIMLRCNKGLLHMRPGVTGWAQVNGRDELSIEKKVMYEEEYLIKKSFIFDLHIIWLSFLKVLKSDGVSH